jgi:hypothetical protein
MADDIYLNLLRILRRDSKDTTYKYTLLGELIEISTDGAQHIKDNGDHISAPMGLLVENKYLIFQNYLYSSFLYKFMLK